MSFQDGEVFGGAPAPVDQEDGGVIAGAPCAFPLQGVREPQRPRPRPSFRVSLLNGVDAADEPFLAERFSFGIPFLDHAVGVAQHAVTALELVLADRRVLTAQADRKRGRALQWPGDLMVADQQGNGWPALTHRRRPVVTSRSIICAVTK